MPELPLAEITLGGYINGFKLLPFAIISLVWLKLMTWADKDAENARLSRDNTNLIHLSLWAIGLVAALFVPNVFIAAPIFLLLFAIDAGIYLGWRNKTVGLKDLSLQFAEWKANLGRKKDDGKVKVSEDNIALIDRSGKPFHAPADDAAEKPGYDALQSILQHPLRVGASRIDLRPAEGGSVVRYTVDGLPFEGKTIQADQAAAGIELMKLLANLDIDEKRRPQTGKIKVQTEKSKHELDVSTAGSKSGEQMKLQVDFKKNFDFRVDTLGLLPDQEKQLLETIEDPGGVVLLTAPEGQGLTNLAYAILKRHDAFLSNIQTLERDPPFELEGITQSKLSASAGAGEETKQASWMVSQQPDVIFLDRCDDPRTAVDLAKYSQDGHRVYIAMRAPNTFDALAQWRKLIGDDGDALKNLKLVVAERLVRVLCDACKIAYKPEPEALKRLNMSPDRVQTLHQPRKEPMRDQKGNEIVCTFCHGLAYKGRTGVFELFRIDDEVRNAVTDGGNVNQYKQLFRKQKQRYLQEAALNKVEHGDTSVEEVLRVLRGPAGR